MLNKNNNFTPLSRRSIPQGARSKKLIIVVIFLFIFLSVFFVGNKFLINSRFSGTLSEACGAPNIPQPKGGIQLLFIQRDLKYDKCVMEYAIKNNNVLTCTKQLNPSCFYFIAKNTKDKNICNSVEGLNMMGCQKAVAWAFTDINLCPSQDSYDKPNCIKDIAFIKKDVSICNQIEKIDVYFWCVSGIAISERDKNICDKLDKKRLPGNFSINNCYKAVDEPKDYINSLTIETSGQLK